MRSVAELVVHDLEIVGRYVDVHVADLPLVRREVASHRQRAVVIVEHRDLVDVNPVRLQLDTAGDVLVLDACRHDRHGPVTDADLPDRVRIGDRAGHANVGLERALDVGHHVVEALDHPEIDRTAVDGEIDAVLGSDDVVV